MVLDPVSALSVAAAVVQFVDFSVRLFDKTKEIKNDSGDSFVEEKQIRAASCHLQEQCAILERHEQSMFQSAAPKSSTGQTCLADVLGRSSEVAQQMLSALDRLFKQASQGRFNNFRQALKIVLGKEKFDQMLSQLNELRSELMLSLLILIR